MFRDARTWADFSNHTTGGRRSLVNSLEVIHDNIHGKLGGNGHMTNLDVAGTVAPAF